VGGGALIRRAERPCLTSRGRQRGVRLIERRRCTAARIPTGEVGKRGGSSEVKIGRAKRPARVTEYVRSPSQQQGEEKKEKEGIPGMAAVVKTCLI